MVAGAGKRSNAAPESVWFYLLVIREDMAYAKMVLAYIIDTKMVLAYIIGGRCDEGELLHFRTIIHK